MRAKNVRLKGPRVTIRPLRKRDLDEMSRWDTFKDPLYRLFDWPRRTAVENGLWYADLWDSVPAEYFTDTPLHADGEGYAILSEHLENLLSSHPDEDSTCE